MGSSLALGQSASPISASHRSASCWVIGQQPDPRDVPIRGDLGGGAAEVARQGASVSAYGSPASRCAATGMPGRRPVLRPKEGSTVNYPRIRPAPGPLRPLTMVSLATAGAFPVASGVAVTPRKWA